MTGLRILAAMVSLSLAVVHPSAALAQAGGPAAAGWTVEVDPMTEMLEMANRNFAEAGQPAFLDGVSFDITRRDGTNPAIEARRTLMDGWARDAAGMLSRQGLAIISDEELQSGGGMTFAQLRAMVIGGSPFGQRADVEMQAGREIHGLLDETPPGCPEGENALIGFVMGYYPIEGVRSEYGSVAVMIVGIGPCSSGSASRRAIAQMKQRVIAAFAGSAR